MVETTQTPIHCTSEAEKIARTLLECDATSLLFLPLSIAKWKHNIDHTCTHSEKRTRRCGVHRGSH